MQAIVLTNKLVAGTVEVHVCASCMSCYYGTNDIIAKVYIRSGTAAVIILQYSQLSRQLTVVYNCS